MRGKKLSIGLAAVSAIFTATLLVAGTGAVAQEKVIHSFNNTGRGGYYPESSLIFDAAGNLYGTTSLGGTGSCTSVEGNGCGVVFELSLKTGGGWTETILHNFTSGTDGGYPSGNLIFDAQGNLYGATGIGGAYGYGTVFELLPKTGGGWAEKILHSFGSGTDGISPGGPILDAQGNLYGVAIQGGGGPQCVGGCGMVYELTPQPDGGWTETMLYSFSGNVPDGINPVGGVIFDAAGNLYGTTVAGGSQTKCAAGCGTVFELSPTTGGAWTETVLFEFNKGDGFRPNGELIFDKSGNLYGTTEQGGSSLGVAFELSPGASGTWTEKVLYKFGLSAEVPTSGLILDSLGNLYGTAPFDCCGSGGGGAVFELSPGAGGGWTLKIIHKFQRPHDGSSPYSGLVFDTAGNLYGATYLGGTYGYGTVFEITP